MVHRCWKHARDVDAVKTNYFGSAPLGALGVVEQKHGTTSRTASATTNLTTATTNNNSNSNRKKREDNRKQKQNPHNGSMTQPQRQHRQRQQHVDYCRYLHTLDK